MTVKKDTITAMFKAGVNVGDDPKTVSQELLKCENGYFDRMGAISKRNGHTVCPTTVAEEILTQWDGKPVAIGNSYLKLFDGSAFDIVDNNIVFADTAVDLLRNESSNVFLYPTIEILNSKLIVAYTNYKQQLAGVWHYYPTVVTYDMATGVQLDRTELETGNGATNNFVRLVNDGSNVYAIYCKSSHYLAYHSIADTGLISASSTNISAAADVIAVRSYDAIFMDDVDDTILVAYPDTSGDIKVRTLRAGSVVDVQTLAATTANSVGLWMFGAKGMLVYYDSGTTYLRQIGYNTALGVASTDHTVDTTTYGGNIYPINMHGTAIDGSFGRLFVTVYNNNVVSTYIRRYTYTDTSSTTAYDKLYCWGTIIASRPFTMEGRRCMVTNYRAKPATGEVSSQSTYILIDENGQPMGKYLVNRSGPSELPTTTDQAIVSNVLTSGDDFILAGLQRTSMALNPWISSIGKAEVLYHDIGISKVTINGQVKAIECIERNGLLLIPNSCPWAFDGQKIVEQGFLAYPEGLAVSQAADGSAAAAAGLYGYRATYERQDAQGNTHKSAASPAISIDLTSGNDVTIDIPNVPVGLGDNVKIVLYRTKVNGDIYYRHMERNNNPLSYTTEFIDQSNDTALAGKALLYTTGGIVDNIQPHPHWLQCVHQGRIFYPSDEYPNTRVYYSANIIEGEGIPHTDVFYVEVPEDGGVITAVASFMGQLLIFKANRIYASGGDGYTDTGQGQNYTTPFEIVRDVGCTNHKSIAKIDRGIIFKTSRELCLLNQTFKVERIGERVRYYTDNYAITAAVVQPEKGYVIFFTASSAIVYSHIFDQWSTFTDHEATDAVECDGTVYWHVSSEVRIESAAYQDNAASIIMTLETGWISLAQLGGIFRVDRVWPVGQNISGHTLNIQTAVDLISYWDAAQQFNATALGSANDADDHYTGLASSFADKAYIPEVRMRRPKCHSIRFRIFDSETAAAVINEGYSITALAMRVGVRPGHLQVGSGRQV